MCVEPRQVVVLVGEDAIGFVVADQWIPSITLWKGTERSVLGCGNSREGMGMNASAKNRCKHQDRISPAEAWTGSGWG